MRSRACSILTFTTFVLGVCFAAGAFAAPAGGDDAADLALLSDRVAVSAKLSPGPVNRGGAKVPVLRFPQTLGDSPTAVLYDNGPLVTHPGGGFGGADASRLQTGLLMNTIGFGHQIVNNNHMADDFTITDPGGWQIDTISFFAYQTGSTTTSTINDVRVQIWDGPPNGGGVLVFGDLVTNRFASTAFTNIYRDTETAPLANNRPIMVVVANIGTTLGPGTYWVEWEEGGTLASGPWAPPVTILGLTLTGNGLQFLGTSGTWGPANDTGTVTQQGLPFVIEGSVLGGASIALTKTVGTVPAVCAATDAITVTTGTTVYYCFYVENTGTETFELHDLVDDHLGTLLTNFALTLPPAGTAEIIVSDVATATVTNTGTWTATRFGPSVSACGGAITIPSSGTGTPYPSQATLAGAPISPASVTVQISGLSHTWPEDIDMLLVGPGGQNLVMMSDTGGSTGVVGINLALEDAAGGLLPVSGGIPSGAYRPTNYSTGDLFAAPAPAGPYSEAAPAGTATFTSSFGGVDPNGTWNLYVVDDVGGDSGNLVDWCVTVPGPVEASASASDTATVTIADPNIVVTPPNLASTQAPDTQATLPLDIQNTGGANLDWTIDEAPPAPFADAPGTYLNQIPNQINGLFADSDCVPLCGTGQQSIAENFTLAAPATIGQITFWGGYFSTNVPLTTDLFRVLIHSDAAGAPGGVVYDESNVASTRVQTGMVLFGVDEWEFTLTLGAPVNLSAGTWWVELFNNTTGSAEMFFWETGNLDVTNGLLGSGWTEATPGVTWNLDPGTDLAIQIDGPSSACFSPSDLPWVSVNPTAGTTLPATTSTVDVTFDSTGLLPGLYEGLLCVNSNDPDTPLVEVPVALTVADSMPFLDGFETNDTSRWSVSVMGPI